jgi:hypothetical protein
MPDPCIERCSAEGAELVQRAIPVLPAFPAQRNSRGC